MKVALIHNAIRPTPDWTAARLGEHGIAFAERECPTGDDVLAFAGEADVVWLMGGSTVITPEILNRLGRCWAILRAGAGTDNIPVDEATRLGIVVAHTPESTTQVVAEHTVALLLSVIRRVAIHDRSIKKGVWDRKLVEFNWHLYGRTLGFIGFGRIAQAVAKRCRGFDMTMIAYDPVVDAPTMGEHDVEAVSFEGLLRRSDYVSIHTPLLEQTYHLMGDPQFRMMKPNAVFINTSRGRVVDESALTRALDEGWIAGAGLDVVETEPPDSMPPLLMSDKVVATPHIAAVSDESHFLMWDHSIRTLIQMSQNCWPPSCVNPNVKPRRSLSRTSPC